MTGKNPSPGRLSGRGLPQLDPRCEQLPYRAPLVGGPVAAVVYAYTVTNTGDAEHRLPRHLHRHRDRRHPCAKSAGYGGGPGGEGCCGITDTAHATATDPQGNRVTSNRATATIQVNGGKDDNCRKQRGGYGKTS
ncbi:hypothetical protein [Streptomyces murinus]|uniref:hypothetical protein n=1 Tax=Streptomyces murinus TaxID=33900 RepID=UPI0036EB3957